MPFHFETEQTLNFDTSHSRPGGQDLVSKFTPYDSLRNGAPEPTALILLHAVGPCVELSTAKAYPLLNEWNDNK